MFFSLLKKDFVLILKEACLGVAFVASPLVLTVVFNATVAQTPATLIAALFWSQCFWVLSVTSVGAAVFVRETAIGTRTFLRSLEIPWCLHYRSKVLVTIAYACSSYIVFIILPFTFVEKGAQADSVTATHELCVALAAAVNLVGLVSVIAPFVLSSHHALVLSLALTLMLWILNVQVVRLFELDSVVRGFVAGCACVSTVCFAVGHYSYLRFIR